MLFFSEKLEKHSNTSIYLLSHAEKKCHTTSSHSPNPKKKTITTHYLKFKQPCRFFGTTQVEPLRKNTTTSTLNPTPNPNTAKCFFVVFFFPRCDCLDEENEEGKPLTWTYVGQGANSHRGKKNFRWVPGGLR